MIKVTERKGPADMVKFVESVRLFLNPLEAGNWRIRRMVRNKVLRCTAVLPDSLCLMELETSQSRARQWDLWRLVLAPEIRENRNMLLQALNAASHD